jgi:integrase
MSNHTYESVTNHDGKGVLAGFHPLSGILPSTEELNRMGRPRYQNPELQKTEAKRPQWYIRARIDVLVDRNRTERKEVPIYFGYCDELGKREAERLKAAKLRDINNTPVVVQSQVMFSDLVKAFTETAIPGLKPSTRKNYQDVIDRDIVPAFGTFRLHEIDPIRVQKWVYGLENDGLAFSTRRSCLSILRGIFEAAADWGYMTQRNPCTKRIKLGDSIEVRERRALEPGQARGLIAAIRDDSRLCLIVELGLYTGLRVSEILGLTWGAIDAKRETIEVKQAKSQRAELSTPKSRAGRRVVEIGDLARRFERPADVGGTDLVWPDAIYGELQRQLKRAAKATGIDFPGFGFHTLRRTYATWRTMLGLSLRADEATVKAMGHASADMTAHYIQGKQTGMVEKLQNWVSFAGELRENGPVQ